MGYRLAAHVLRAPLEEQEVLLSLETGIYHLVNATGRAILAGLEVGLELEEAAAAVSRDMDERLDRVAVDATLFVEALMERGLMEERP